MLDDKQLVNFSYLYCMDSDLGWGNRTYFTFFSQFNRGADLSLFSAIESAVLVLFFVLSTLSNLVIFYTLSSNRRLRTVTNYFVCNLTLADVCFTLCCPFVAVVRITGTWSLGSFACKTIVYLSCVCGFVTIWTLALISIDRYTCIVRSSKRRITPPVALVLIAVVWILTLAAFSPLLLYFVVKDCPFGTDTVSICTLGWPRTPGVSVPVVFTSIVCSVGFVLPCVILVVCHLCIFVKVYKVRVAMRQQRQRRFSTSSAFLANTAVWTTPAGKTSGDTNHHNGHATACCLRQTAPDDPSDHNGSDVVQTSSSRTQNPGRPFLPNRQSEPLLITAKATGGEDGHHPRQPQSPPPPLSPASNGAGNNNLFSGNNFTSTLEARKRRRSGRDLQVVKTLVCLVLLFFAMWLPIFVVFVLIMRDAYYDVTQVSSQAFLAAMCVAYCNAVLNPLAYGLSTERLRAYLRAILTCSGKLGRSASPTQASQGQRGVSGGVGGSRGGGGGGGGDGARHALVGNGAGRLAGKSSGGTSVSRSAE